MSKAKRNSIKAATVAALAMAILLSLSLLATGTGAPAASGGDANYYFVGYGRAHGVGMCMDGVYYRAKEGQDYHAILNYYYTGISFTKTDEARAVRVKGRDGQIRTWTLHDYLHHLQEEPESAPIEELKCLYVSARTYTLNVIARNKHTAEGFDICSSGDCCQACDENKTIANYPNNNAAVDATAGEIMTYNGAAITAAYHGSCGGHTENNEDVWHGSAIPYLRGKPDDYCHNSPRFAWSASFSKADVEARLNSRSDTAVGSLYVMDLSDRTPGGRVRTARITGSAAIKRVNGEVIEGLFGFQSTKFDLVRSNFDQYILVLNPNPEPAVVTFTFMKPDGSTSDVKQQVAANSRYTLKVNDYMQFQEMSTRVDADKPVICERAMYFNMRNRFNGGSDSMGSTSKRKKWYLAEGYTSPDFETYVLVQNPNANPADVTYTFMVVGGKPPVVKTARVPAMSRATLRVNDVPGLDNTDVSTVVECTSGDGIIAERSMYFDYYGRDGGHNSPGVPSPSNNWYLAEGYTGGGFDTYNLIQNPNNTEAVVEATYMKEDGATIKKTYHVGPKSRYTVHVDTIVGLENAGFSTRLESTNGVGIIAEHSLYFDYNGAGLDDGSNSTGVTAPAGKWYFAEGYTGGRFDTYVLIENPDPKAADVKVTFNTPSGGAVEKSYNIKPRSRFTIHVDEVAGLADTEVSTTVESTNGVGVVAERAMYFVYSDGYCTRDGGHDATGTTAPSSVWYFAEGYTGF
jgi:SpoIID/LytB domain protein